MSEEKSASAQASEYWVIENLDRPGHFWNAKTREFRSELSGDWTTYTTEQKGQRAFAERSRRGRRVSLRRWVPMHRCFEVTLAFHRHGSAADMIWAATEPEAIEKLRKLVADDPSRIEWDTPQKGVESAETDFK